MAISPDQLAQFQQLGWAPGGQAPPPAPAPTPAPDVNPPPAPAQPAYRPIGAPNTPTPNLGYGPGAMSNPAADAAALNASLTNGGTVGGKGGAGGAGMALPPAAAGPATKAGYQPSTRDTEITGGVQATPEMQSAQQGFEQAGAAVNRAQGEVAALQGPEAKARSIEEAINEQHIADQEYKRQQDYNNELAGEKWKRDKAHAAYDQAVANGVDQHAYVKKLGTLGTIATALSVMAGGFVSAKTGQPNAALDMFNKGIDREVQSQLKNIDEKSHQADVADSHLALFMKEGMDKQQAAAATYVLLRQQAAKQLDAKYNATSNAMGRLALAKAIQDNQKLMLDKESEYAKLTGDTVKRKVDEKWQAASAGGAGDLRTKYLAYAKAQEDKGAKIDSYGDWYARSQTGQGGEAQPKDGGGKVSPRLGLRLSAVDNAGSALDKVEQLEKGSWGPGATGQAEGSGAVAQARSAMLEAGIDPGAVNSVFPEGYNPRSAHLTGAPIERIKQARAMIEHQKKVVGGAVDMSRGGAEPDTGEP